MKYEFDTTVGEGSEVVTVVMEYETDEEGIYEEYIEEIWFEGRNVTGLLSAEQFMTIEMEGSMRLSAHILEESDHAKTVEYDLRNV